MKVNVKPDGTVELNVTNGEGTAAAELVDALQAKAREREKLKGGIVVHGDVLLSKLHRDTLHVLREFDHPEGVHVSGLAAVLEITPDCASERISHLIKRGLVIRVRRGYYRAKDCGQ